MDNASAMRELVCGSVAGATGKLFEYPFDTIKVRLQVQPMSHGQPGLYKGPVDCFVQSWHAHGFAGFYKGVGSPLVGAAAETASLFYSYNLARQYVTNQGPLATAMTCGAVAGVSTSFLLTPVELIKCRMQILGHTGTILSTVASIYRADGLKGFWRGHIGTLLRESGGSAAWFTSYEAVCLYFQTDGRNTIGQRMLAGACAGVMYNLTLFPADTIKSQIQTLPQSRGFVEVGRDIVNRGGLKALYRGCGITVLRAAPSSALIFTTYSQLMAI